MKRYLPKLLCAIGGFFCAVSITAQSPSKLHFEYADAPEGSFIPLGSDLPNNPGTYLDYLQIAPFENGEAVAELHHNRPAWISILGSAQIGRLHFVIEPGDSLHFALRNNPEGGVFLSITGDHAELISEILRRELLDPQAYRVPNVLKKETSYSDAGAILREYFDQISASVDSLTRGVGDEYRKTLAAEQEQVALMALILRLPSSNPMAKRLLNDAFERWNPFLPKYQNTRYGFLNREIFLADEERREQKKGQLTDGKNLQMWPTELSYRNLLSPKDQEHLYATELSKAYYMDEKWDRDRHKTRLRFFSTLFPESEYYTYLDKLLTDRRDADNSFIFGEYFPSVGQFHYIERYPSADLKEVVRKEFSGTPVLVDVWATYCGPCKAEFPYEPALHQWLASKGIELLHVSVDKGINSGKWFADIQRYGLGGYHYMLTFKGYDRLSKQLSSYLTTPRYILFNEKGEIVDDKLPRPSEKDNALFNRIQELIDLGELPSTESKEQ